MKTVLVTGAAGFIGYHLAKRLLDENYHVVGYDNLNNYYDVKIKINRLEILKRYDRFDFIEGDIQDYTKLITLFEQNNINKVVNLAAQAGVRYSLENPKAYIDSNISGFLNILELCREKQIEHLIYASSSSVYGGNTKIPFSVTDNVDHPVSLYAATKKSNELMAHTYSHLFNIPTTGLRFFTVYGPWGRPDMALFKFTKNILEDKPIKVFNNGNMVRDFTYVDDIVEEIYRLIDIVPQADKRYDSNNPNPAISNAPYRIYNIGNSNPVKLEDFIRTIENRLGKKAIKEYLPLQDGDVPKTYAYVDDLIDVTGFKPQTSIKDGIEKFIDWYIKYYKNDKQ